MAREERPPIYQDQGSINCDLNCFINCELNGIELIYGYLEKWNLVLGSKSKTQAYISDMLLTEERFINN